MSKDEVRKFWEVASCGEDLYFKGDSKVEKYKNHLRKRYELEPFIIDFAEFDKWRGKEVLEVGVGLGADHFMFAKSGAHLFGIDLTQRSIEHTKEGLKLIGESSNLKVGDAEKLSFDNEKFDLVYSWGVIHHSPDTSKCIDEIHRVLKPGGSAKIMIYHKYSMVGYMLWLRYGLGRLRPFTSLQFIYSKYLESSGTKTYSENEAKNLFSEFKSVDISTILGHGDLLESMAGQRHKGIILTMARKIYPRWLIKKFFKKHGLFMMIEAIK